MTETWTEWIYMWFLFDLSILNCIKYIHFSIKHTEEKQEQRLVDQNMHKMFMKLTFRRSSSMDTLDLVRQKIDTDNSVQLATLTKSYMMYANHIHIFAYRIQVSFHNKQHIYTSDYHSKIYETLLRFETCIDTYRFRQTQANPYTLASLCALYHASII